jgi:threonine aldolase
LISLPDSTGIITGNSINQYFSGVKCHATESKASLLWLENTISGLAGKVYPLEELRNVHKTAKEVGLAVHLDGARLLNACVASGVPPKEYCKYTDSLMFTFTKGIGAPFGAVLVGDYKFINEAKIYKKKFGGGMHQSGIMAAACRYALENNVEKLEQDHKRAKLFAKLLLDEDKDVGLNITIPETNIVIIDVSSLEINAALFIEAALQKCLLLYPWSKNCVRAVFHSGVDDNMVFEAARIIREITISSKHNLH